MCDADDVPGVGARLSGQRSIIPIGIWLSLLPRHVFYHDAAAAGRLSVWTARIDLDRRLDGRRRGRSRGSTKYVVVVLSRC